MKKIGLLTTLLVAGLLLTGCFEKVQDCISGEAACTKEIGVEETNIDELINGFSGTILNGTEIKLFDITGDNTLYYNDQFGFAVILGKQWKGGKVELKTHNEQFGENAIGRSIHFYKEGFEYDVYSLSIDKIEKYDSMKKQDVFWTEDEFEKGIKGKNNKYFFVGYASDQLAPYIDTTNEYQQLFLDGFVFYDVNVEVEEDYKVCKRYFDGCNWCTMQDNGDYICTEEACEQHQEPYCGDEPVVEEPNNDSSKKIFSTGSEYSSCDYYILDKDSIKINDLDSLLYDCSVNYYKKERIQNNIIDIKMRTFLDNDIVEISETGNNNILCKDFGLSNIQKQYFGYGITGDNSDFKEFLLKHKIYDKKLLTQAIYEYKSSEIQEIDSQSKFAYGDNERHYYLGGFIFYDKKRDNENIKRVLLIDDNYYSRNYNLYDDKYNLIASEWLVSGLKNDFLYLSRNTVNNSEENLKSIETCKLNLKKVSLK